MIRVRTDRGNFTLQIDAFGGATRIEGSMNGVIEDFQVMENLPYPYIGMNRLSRCLGNEISAYGQGDGTSILFDLDLRRVFYLVGLSEMMNAHNGLTFPSSNFANSRLVELNYPTGSHPVLIASRNTISLYDKITGKFLDWTFLPSNLTEGIWIVHFRARTPFELCSTPFKENDQFDRTFRALGYKGGLPPNLFDLKVRPAQSFEKITPEQFAELSNIIRIDDNPGFESLPGWYILTIDRKRYFLPE
jgi:hypothetical protein